MDIGSISNNSPDIKTLLYNVSADKNANNKGTINDTARYAEKGEPMYMEEMDADGDGVVTLDEFKEYFKSKGMNTKEMLKMSQLASTYRTMKAESETINNISKLIPHFSPKVKQADSNSINVKQEQNKFNISNDVNNDKKVSYDEYMEYCRENVTSNEIKSNTKVEEEKDGTLKITNYGKAKNLYKKNETHSVLSTFEDVV